LVRSKSCEAVRCGGEKEPIMEAVETERGLGEAGIDLTISYVCFPYFFLEKVY
jgi:hypothetical protein